MEKDREMRAESHELFELNANTVINVGCTWIDDLNDKNTRIYGIASYTRIPPGVVINLLCKGCDSHNAIERVKETNTYWCVITHQRGCEKMKAIIQKFREAGHATGN